MPSMPGGKNGGMPGGNNGLEANGLPLTKPASWELNDVGKKRELARAAAEVVVVGGDERLWAAERGPMLEVGVRLPKVKGSELGCWLLPGLSGFPPVEEELLDACESTDGVLRVASLSGRGSLGIPSLKSEAKLGIGGVVAEEDEFSAVCRFKCGSSFSFSVNPCKNNMFHGYDMNSN